MYEVKKDGITLMSTESKSCFYTREIRDTMRKAGYKLYENGKIFKEEKKK